MTHANTEAAALGLTTFLIGFAFYSAELLSAESLMVWRRHIASALISGVLGSVGATVVRELAHTSPALSVALGLVVSFMGGTFWQDLAAKAIERYVLSIVRQREGTDEKPTSDESGDSK